MRTSDPDQPLVEVIYQKRFLARGPRIVAIGGGDRPLDALRRSKAHTSNLTAVVTVATMGGSSEYCGRARIPPVGDIRNCIAALADAEPLMNSWTIPIPVADTATPARTAWTSPAMPSAISCSRDDGIVGADFEGCVRRINRILAVRR